jgi:HlyD family secretion protein
MLGCADNGGPAGGSGLVETSESIVSAETAGRVLQHRFAEGSQVHSGDTLVVIDPSRTELELDAARAGINVLEAQLSAARTGVRQAVTAEDFARNELSRAEKLLSSGTGTDLKHDQAKYTFDQATIAAETARAQVATLKAQLQQASVNVARLERRLLDHYPVAPIDGLILEKFVDPGELLAPGKPIARIAQLDTVWVKVYLTTERFAGVKLGDPATVTVESADMTYPGVVVWTSSEAEFTPKNVQTEQARADLVYAVKVSIPNPDHTLKVGMPVFVTLEN